MTEKFITKDSGKRQEWNSGMRRDIQEDKPRFDLITPLCVKYSESMLYRWAMLMNRGAVKYGDRNWEKANSQEELDRFKASAFRHFMQWMAGEDDEDHASAVMFNLSGAEMVKQKMKGGKK
jgi:hypothetical protein